MSKKRRPKPKTQAAPAAITRAAQTGDWSSLTRSASAEMRRIRGQIEAGETFASQKPHDREPAPSAKSSRKNS